jgi:hypothetical protein
MKMEVSNWHTKISPHSKQLTLLINRRRFWKTFWKWFFRKQEEDCLKPHETHRDPDIISFPRQDG